MIRRLYVHNFKCFINFEIRQGDFQLIAGPNGAGKSAFFEVLKRLKAFICEDARIYAAFPITHTSQGLTGNDGVLRVELDLEDHAGKMFSYTLEVEYDRQQMQQRVALEHLTCNQTPLFEARRGEAQLYRDDGSTGPRFPMDWTQSGVGFLMPGKDNIQMTWFKKRLASIWTLRIAPDQMREESRKEVPFPAENLANFADWYRFVVQDQPDTAYRLTEVLRERISGFRSLRLQDAGEGKILYAVFESETGAPFDIPFEQLSEGQKALVGLYAVLISHFSRSDVTLCIDEPENFLALPEIQPWLDSAYEACNDGRRQLLLISHHPRIINFLAADTGIWFERTRETGPSRSYPITVTSRSPISIDQLIERGWIDGGKI